MGYAMWSAPYNNILRNKKLPGVLQSKESTSCNAAFAGLRSIDFAPACQSGSQCGIPVFSVPGFLISRIQQ